ncbi:MAG: baseplate J/gp47 family protein, partial [Candidatus Limnocylindrales bacterium]
QRFPATGERVEETEATGTVRFRNKDFTRSNSIPRGSIVSTAAGVRFRTDRAITVPRAELVGLQIFPASATVDVTAVDAGPEGNVEPNTILTIPRGEDPLTLDVTNPDATTGGAREEFPRITQEDVDAAVAALTTVLDATFRDQLDDPALVGDGTTVFPDTATLGPPTFDVDLATLVGQEVDGFDLSASAQGTVLAVDEAPVQAVAEGNIDASVEPGYQLVEGSSIIDPEPAVVENGVVTFPVVVTATQVLDIDPAAIEAEILGKPLAEARTILARYGTVQLSVWPDWVGTIPTFDARVEVSSATPITVETPGSSPASSAEASP